MVQKDKSRAWLSFIEMLEQCIVFLAAIYTFYFGLFKMDNTAILYGLWVPAVTILAFAARKWVQKIQLFIFSNIFIFIIAYIFSISDEMILSNMIMALVISLYSIKLKNHKISLITDQEMPIRDGYTASQAKEKALKSMLISEAVPIYAVAIIIIGYIVGSIQNMEVLMMVEALLSIVFVLLALIHNNANYMYRIFQLNKDKADFPAGQLKYVNKYVNIISIVLIMLSMLAFYNGKYGNMFSLVQSGAYQIIRLLISAFLFLLGLSGGDSEVKEPIKENKDPQDYIDDTELEYTDSPILEAIAEAVGFFLILAIFAGIIYILVHYIKNFNRTKKQGFDIVEFVKPKEEKEYVKKAYTKNHYKESKSVKSVRKIYKMAILKGTKGDVPDCSSLPSKLTKDNITEDEIKAAAITQIYEKARYSEEKITEEETDLIKNYINNAFK